MKKYIIYLIRGNQLSAYKTIVNEYMRNGLSLGLLDMMFDIGQTTTIQG